MYGTDRKTFYSMDFDFRKRWSIVLAAPTPRSPRHGAIFDDFPRRTVLQWSAVPTATAYQLEIQYSSRGKWSALTKPKVRGTSHSFNFVGAQPGRWRVHAIDSTEEAGEWSEWQEFRYTR